MATDSSALVIKPSPHPASAAASAAVRLLVVDEPSWYVLDASTELHRGGLARLVGMQHSALRAFAEAMSSDDGQGMWDQILDGVGAQTLTHLGSVYDGLSTATAHALCPWLARSWTWLPPSVSADPVLASGGGSHTAHLFTLLAMATAVRGPREALALALWSGALDRAHAHATRLSISPNPCDPSAQNRVQSFTVTETEAAPSPSPSPDSTDTSSADAADAAASRALGLQAVGLTLYSAYLGNVLLHYASAAFPPAPPQLLALYELGTTRAHTEQEAADIATAEADYITPLMQASLDALPVSELTPYIDAIPVQE